MTTEKNKKNSMDLQNMQMKQYTPWSNTRILRTNYFTVSQTINAPISESHEGIEVGLNVKYEVTNPLHFEKVGGPYSKFPRGWWYAQGLVSIVWLT